MTVSTRHVALIFLNLKTLITVLIFSLTCPLHSTPSNLIFCIYTTVLRRVKHNLKITIMGASESREDSHNQLVEEKNATPIQNRRILTLQDPRSPSESIHRTPIITDTTDFQDPRSPTAEICRTPVEETADPRSPTEGIPRTPANPFVFPDPRSPSIGITRTPMIKTIEGELKED